MEHSFIKGFFLNICKSFSKIALHNKNMHIVPCVGSLFSCSKTTTLIPTSQKGSPAFLFKESIFAMPLSKRAISTTFLEICESTRPSWPCLRGCNRCKLFCPCFPCFPFPLPSVNAKRCRSCANRTCTRFFAGCTVACFSLLLSRSELIIQ